jgi:DNA-binding transcriptional MocR family regulator
LIDSGDLQEGFQLPSSRQLAISLGVNRSTVIRAYEELWALGYLESTPGSYTKVRKRKVSNREFKNFAEKDTFWEEMLNSSYRPDFDKVNKFSELITSNNGSIICFDRLEPDSRLIDVKLINNCYREAIANQDQSVFGYCHPSRLRALASFNSIAYAFAWC